MMNLPICDVCVKTGLLCGACEKKLDSGSISELDVELSKILYELDHTDVGFARAIDTKNSIIILTDRDSIGKLIGRDGANIKAISKRLGKPVRVISTGSFNEMVYDLVAPAKVNGISKVHRPDGSTIKRIRIKKNDVQKLRMAPDDLQRVISSLSEKPSEIIFE